MNTPSIRHNYTRMLSALREYIIALFVLFVTLLMPAAGALAVPTVHRDGANHHLGDDSFIARFGSAPTAADNETLRMRVHLEYVRLLLASRPATELEFRARRAQLLGYLDEYIAKGATPKNTYVPWRNPVFIDARGVICAVGYLIERSAGRALAERIAADHRLQYLEDIAAAMPEVAAWVAASGFTLDELASIQPGYEGPNVMHLTGWVTGSDSRFLSLGRQRPADGVYRDDDGFEGRFERGQMTGEWRQTQNGAVVGSGVFHHGAGTWKSLRADGTLLATGPFRASHADGAWRFFHPGGRLAASGSIRAGRRDGAWQLYYDAPGSPLLAGGEFARGEALGAWKHYAANGTLIATSSGRAGTGFTLDVEPGRDGVRHVVRQGLPADPFRVDGFFLGGDRLYITREGDMFDAEGNRIERVGGEWRLRVCRDAATHRAAARAGNVRGLHQTLRTALRDDDKLAACDGTTIPVARQRAQHYDRMLASRANLHAPTPGFDVDPAWRGIASDRPGVADSQGEQNAQDELARTGNPLDMATYLASHMTWYVEFPHVDRTFERVYASLPGYNFVADSR